MDSTNTSWLHMWELAQNIPLPWVKSNGPWMLHASGNQCGTHISIKLGHLNLVQIAINPVQFPCNPVHSQALWCGQAMLHNHLNSSHTWNTKNNTIAWLCSTNIVFKGQQWLASVHSHCSNSIHCSGKEQKRQLKLLRKALPYKEGCFLQCSIKHGKGFSHNIYNPAAYNSSQVLGLYVCLTKGWNRHG